MNITAKSDSEDIRIYIDETLHLRIPRDKNMIIQSFHIEVSKLYTIEIKVKKHIEYVEYEDRKLWVKVLQLLDENI